METGQYELNLMADPRIPFRITRGITTGNTDIPNWHENTEVLYCAAGSGYFQYNEKQYAVTPGDMVVISSEMLHGVSTDDFMEFCCLIPDRNFCMESGIPTTKLTFQELIRDENLSAVFLRIFEAKERYQRSGQYYEIAAIRAAVLDFLYLLCRDYTTQQTKAAVNRRGEAVKAAVIYIKKHLQEPLTLEIIADHTGINKYYLARLFRQVLGRSVFDTVRALRCNEARHLIEKGVSVTEAAYSCGFESLSHFTRTFKKYHGVLPSRCRQEPL